MADNINVTPGSGATIAAEDVGGGVLVQRVKVALGATDVDNGNVSATNPMPVTGSVSVSNFPATQPVSGTVTANAGTGTFAVSAASLPLPSGAATSALQTSGNSSLSSIDSKTPALGQALAAASVPVVLPAAQITTLTPPTTVTVTQSTAGNLNATVTGSVSVSNFPVTQPVSGTVAVSNFPATQPVSGTVTANAGTGNFTVVQATASNLNATVTGTVNATQSGTWNINNVSGTVSLPTGAATSALQTTGNTSLATIVTNTTGITVAQGSTTSGQAGQLQMGAVTTAAPSYTNAQTSPLSLTTSGNLRVDNSAALGTAGTGITPPTGGAGALGYLSGIYQATSAQSTDALQTGTITALNGSVSINAQGAYTVSALISGTWVATLVAEGLMADGTTWQQLPMYVVQTSLPYPSTFTVTTNASVLITGGGYTSIRIRSSAFTSGTVNVALNASLAQQTIFSSQLGNWSVNSIPVDGNKATFSASIAGLAPGTTDIFTITGSASKLVKITRVTVTATQTTATQRDVLLIKRSTANTGGTSTTQTAVPHDSTNPAATATVRAYTANPAALGTSVGQMRARKVFIGTTTGNSDECIWDFGNRPAQCIALRSTSEVLAVNLNGVASAGGSFDINIEWTEE